MPHINFTVKYNVNCGYALFEWNEEAQMWNQITRWYKTKSNFNKFIGNKYGIYI